MPPEIFAPVSLLCAGLVLIQYYRRGRLIGGIGWALLILAVGGFGSGLASSFAWSGLLFLFVGGMGLIAILQDAAIRRHARRRRDITNPPDLERET